MAILGTGVFWEVSMRVKHHLLDMLPLVAPRGSVAAACAATGVWWGMVVVPEPEIQLDVGWCRLPRESPFKNVWGFTRDSPTMQPPNLTIFLSQRRNDFGGTCMAHLVPSTAIQVRTREDAPIWVWRTLGVMGCQVFKVRMLLGGFQIPR